jgi:glycine cleavage system regulatory protein
MRSQFKVQQELEGKANSQDQELQNLMSSGVSPSISELIGENNLMKQVEEASYKLKRARSRRPQYLEELGDILEGQHARIAALQSERTPSALEIIQMMEGIGG